MSITIQQVLATPPEELLAMSDAELQALLEPFIPLVRKAELPQEKPRKLGMEVRAIKDAISNSKEELQAMLAQMKGASK